MNEFDRIGGTHGSAFGAPSEADPAPGLLSVIWNFSVDDDKGSAQELADAYGGFVLEPTRWPVSAQEPQYVLDPPNPVSPLLDVASYGIAAELAGHPVRLIVTGRWGESPHEAGRHGWFAVPDLSEWNGLGRDDGFVAHVCIEREGQTIHVTMFPSVDDAVTVALGLRLVPPT